MRPIVEALAAQDAELEELLAGLDSSAWTTATPCEGWDVADVVIHLAQTNEFAVACIDGVATGGLAASGASTADEAAALAVAADRGQSSEAVFERWRTSALAQRAALQACDPAQRVPWVIGELPARTLATTRLSETWIHTTDVARAVGAPVELSDRLWNVARLAWRTLPYAFARAGRDMSGPVAVFLDGPGDEPWEFTGEDEPVTVVRGDALDFCLVAARRRDPADTELTAEGPDADDVLALVRTYA